MGSFKEYISNSLGNYAENTSEEEKDVKNTIAKLPKKHQALLHGYKFKFQGGNTLKGDNDHVGYMDNEPKVIGVAAPWFYSREFTLLHEIAHIVWEKLINPQIRNMWQILIVALKRAMPENNILNDNNPEELFCMTYATSFATHRPADYNIKPLVQFIDFISNSQR